MLKARHISTSPQQHHTYTDTPSVTSCGILCHFHYAVFGGDKPRAYSDGMSVNCSQGPWHLHVEISNLGPCHRSFLKGVSAHALFLPLPLSGGLFVSLFLSFFYSWANQAVIQGKVWQRSRRNGFFSYFQMKSQGRVFSCYSCESALGLTFKPLLGQTQFGCQLNEEKERRMVGGVMHCIARNERMKRGRRGSVYTC